MACRANECLVRIASRGSTGCERAGGFATQQQKQFRKSPPDAGVPPEVARTPMRRTPEDRADVARGSAVSQMVEIAISSPLSKSRCSGVFCACRAATPPRSHRPRRCCAPRSRAPRNCRASRSRAGTCPCTDRAPLRSWPRPARSRRQPRRRRIGRPRALAACTVSILMGVAKRKLAARARESLPTADHGSPDPEGLKSIYAPSVATC